MKCQKCGCDLLSTDTICKSCGQPVETTELPKQKTRKKKGCLIAILTLFVILGVAVLCIALFLPGFFAPKNLGVKTSEEAYNSALSKLMLVKDTSASTGGSDNAVTTYGEVQTITTTLTSEELTSLFNYNSPNYYSLDKVQIKINQDNTLEISASVDTDYLLDTFLGGEYSKEELLKANPVLNVIPDTVNIYGELSGEIIDNKSNNIAFKNIEVMGLNLPTSYYATSSAQNEISTILDGFLENATESTGGSYDSITIQNGELLINGQFPSK